MLVVIVRVAEVLRALKEVERIPARPVVIPRIIIVRLASNRDGEALVDALRNSIGADRRSFFRYVARRAGIVGVVAGPRRPAVASGAEVKLPPRTIEDVGAGGAAVQFRGDGKRGDDAVVGVAVWVGRIGLQAGGADGGVGCDGGGGVGRAG